MKRPTTAARGDPGSPSASPRAVYEGGTAYLVWAVLRSLPLLKTVLGFVATVVKRFFLDQFAFKLRLRSRRRALDGSLPVVRNVEHPLDAAIPIRYETVGVYLTFIQLWISSLSYLRRRLGPSFNDDIAAFLQGLRRCYVDASGVYGRGLTTTRRPDRAPSPRFAFIYAVDPHLFCVPSLHVLVVCYTYKRLEGLLRGRGDYERFEAELAAVEKRAAAITESILYVRQHSVNCIPTALAMLSVIEPSYDAAEARRFLSGLFAGDPDISDRDRGEVLAYMLELYGRVAGGAPETRYDAIASFVAGYEETAPAEASAAPARKADREGPSEPEDDLGLEPGALSEA